VEVGLSLVGKTLSSTSKPPSAIAFQYVQSQDTSIRLAAVNLLTATTRSINDDIDSFWAEIETVVRESMSDSDDVLRTATMKLMEQFSLKVSKDNVGAHNFDA
jgi:uncharacterized membrane-anchored protein YjiN (DUF445 family)